MNKSSKSINVTAPNGFEVGKTTGGPFSDNLLIAFPDWKLESDGSRTKPVFVRLKANASQGSVSGTIQNVFGPQFTSFNVAVSGTVTLATTSVNPTSLSDFTTNQSTPSAPKSFTISGTNLPVLNPAIIGVSATALTGFEVATSASGPFSDKLQTLTGVAANGTGSRELFVRLKGTAAGPVNGTVQDQLGSFTTSNLDVSGTVNGASLLPVMTVNPTSLSGFSTVKGNSSATKQYTLSANNVAAGQTLIVKAPAGYELSLPGASSSFSPQIEFKPTGSLAPTQLVVRLAANATPGVINSSIQHTTNPATVTVNLFLGGQVIDPTGPKTPPIFHGPLANQTVRQGSNVNFSLPDGTFTIPENQPLVLSATGLPNGLSFNGNTVSGIPTELGSFVVTLTATDPIGWFNSGTFTLTVTTADGQIPNPDGRLQLMTPLYDCETGGFTFQTSGSDGTPIEFSAIGITGPTTNPNQFVDKELRTAADSQPITLRARQSGTEVTFIFDIRAICPVGGRQAAPAALTPELGSKLRALVYPNPVQDDFTVGIEGAPGQTVRLLLTDLNRRTIVDRLVAVTTPKHEERLRLDGQPGGM